MDEEIRVIGYCAECESKITDDVNEYYCDPDGHFFCSHDCVLEYFNVVQMEV